ncbi:glycosyltransferase family 4 protein [uncultured Slackia sp.]|uniref:glycosyltransferase family 4 protein n=1 Tax=uncultured Slackia sp. TaxID=665903 RepID=UPI00280B7D0E|nr:glycosyltransferase family 4 protein [uncultured Slackia sp.]
MAKKHIVIFSTLFLPHVGGVENYTFHLASELADLGFAVTVVTLTKNDSNNDDEYPFTVMRLQSHYLLNGRLPLAKFGTSRELKSITPDYVIINTRFYPHSFTGIRFAKRNKVQPLIIEHGSAHITLGNPLIDRVVEAYEHLMTRLLSSSNAIYCGVSARCSEWLHHFNITSSGELANSIDAENYQSLSSGRDYRTELQPGSKPLICFAGRIVPEKGIEPLLKAAANIPDAFFCIAGDGPLLQKLKQAYEMPHIHFLGNLTQPEMSSLLQQANIFCLPSRSEGFSTSLLEAAACKAMPVITDVGGARELIPNREYGIILQNNDPETIQEALLTAIENPESTQTCANNVYERVVSQYSWKKTAEKAIRICRSLETPANQ